MAFSLNSFFPGGAAADLGLGGQLQDQVAGETEEERKRRLALQQQQQNRNPLTRFSSANSPAFGAATTLGLSMGY